MATNWPIGLGETTGDPLLIGGEVTTSGAVWFVSSTSGSNSYDGRSHRRPLATVAQAITSAATGDIIVLLDGHTETFAASITLTKTLTFVASGKTTAGLPTVKLSFAAGRTFTVNAAGTQFRNIWFPALTSPANRFTVTQVACVFQDCYFECGPADNGYAVVLGTGADRARFVRTKFISTSTTGSSQPGGGITSNVTLSGLTIQDCTFDGGYGNHAFLGFWAQADVTPIIVEGGNLTNGAELTLTDTTVGVVNISTAGGGIVNWQSTGSGIRTWPRGFWGSGDRLSSESPVITNMQAVYVSSLYGSDANDGQMSTPYATLAFAIGAEGSGIFFLMDGHTETFTANLNLTSGCWVVGMTRSNGQPTAKLTNNQAGNQPIFSMGSGSLLANVWIKADLQANTKGPVYVLSSTAQALIRGCYFEQTNTANASVTMETGTSMRVEDTTFLSTATSLAARPPYGISTTAAAVVTDVDLSGCVFDGGLKGYQFGGFDMFTAGATSKRIRLESCSLLRGAVAEVQTAQTGHAQVSTSTGGAATVVW